MKDAEAPRATVHGDRCAQTLTSSGLRPESPLLGGSPVRAERSDEASLNGDIFGDTEEGPEPVPPAARAVFLLRAAEVSATSDSVLPCME